MFPRERARSGTISPGNPAALAKERTVNDMKKQKRHALFVGVDEYEDKNIHPLSCAVSDATALRDFFAARKDQFDRVELLVNPKSFELTDKVDDLTAKLESGDLFFFYFAGHGVDYRSGEVLLTSDTRVRRSVVSGGSFPLEYVTDNSKWHTAVVLDACRSPLERNRAGVETEWQMRDVSILGNLVESGGEGNGGSKTVLFSCDEKMSAGEVPTKGHGLFTLALLDVLERADRGHRRIDLDQAFCEEIGEGMRRIAGEERLPGSQRPGFRASGKPPLFLRPSLDTQPLVDWALSLHQRNTISSTEYDECRKAIEGRSEKPNGRSLFEFVRFFSNWEEERTRDTPPSEFVGALIKAFCSEPVHIVYKDRPSKDRPSPDSSASSAPSAGAALSDEDVDLIDKFRNGVSAGRERLAGLRSAATDEQAIAALHEIMLGWLGEFGKKNALHRSGQNSALSVRISQDCQAEASRIRRLPEAERTPVQAAFLQAVNAALSLGTRG